MHFRADAQKVLLLITAAPPHEQGDGTSFSQVRPAALTTKLCDAGFTVYAVAYDHPAYQTIVSETRGKFYELTPFTDFTGIIDEIGGDIAKQYRLTYKSPRSSYDGTRRNIVIKAAGRQSDEVNYLEKHLLNIQSDPVIGIILLLPPLLALAAPPFLSRWRTFPTKQVL